jgi:hypothetical protein
VKAIYGLYRHGRDAQSAIDRLKTAGAAERDITVLSPEPREDLPFSHMHSRTHMWSFACLGGAIGFASATGLLLYGETSWPIVVGGLPIVAWWPNLIIQFELTMLGAIAATVITLLVSGELAISREGIYDAEVTSGNILVGVENPPDGSVDSYERALTVGGDVRIKKV